MDHTKSESDLASLAPSSPSRSPKRPIYYVQSPSRDSQDGDKSCSMQATPMYNSPMESPSHPSMGRHSRNSSASRFSGIFRSSSGRKGSKKHRASSNNHHANNNDKGWPECKVIMEEGGYDHDNDDKIYARRVQILIGLFSFVVLFSVFCLIIWGAARPYKAHVSLKSLVMKSFIIQEGTDFSGVPTRLVTVNSSLKMSIRNPATFFGIHVSTSPINLQYSKMNVATGQLVNHYQPRKSTRAEVIVNLKGDKVPLYGAGSNLTVSSNGYDLLPFTLDFEVREKAYVVGKLVTTRHRGWISCPLMVNYTSTKPIRFKKNSCTFS